MATSTLSLTPAVLAAVCLLTRAMAPLAREARNCLLLWLALRGTRPEQRPQVIKALPPLDQQPPARSSRSVRRRRDPAAVRAEGSDAVGVTAKLTPAAPHGTRARRPIAHPEDKIEYARLLKAQGNSLGAIAAKTGIPKTSLHRYLLGAGAGRAEERSP